MNVCRISHSFALLAVIAVASSPVAGKPLPTDSRIRTGKLGNGLTWMYRKHDNPPGKMAFNLHVRSGSLNETDAQQGLAHFLEHMCFNGTDNFPPGKLIPYFEGIGMQFGQHLNAFTSFDQTVYMLFTPTTDVDRVDEALMVLSDYAFRCLLLEEEIDKERGVVLEESRTGKGPFERLRNQVWPRLFPGTRFANRLPIGKEEIVENATRQDFVDYYRTWYRPENMTLVMVGDAEPDAFLPIIDKWFGQYKPAVPARPQEIAGFKPFTERRAIVATDPEMQWASLQMTRIDEGRPPTTDFSQARTELVEGIGSWLVGRRFDDQIQKGNASYLFAGASVSSFFNDGMIVDGSTRGEPGQWEDMLQQLIVEIKRAREHGFTEREIEMAKKEFIATAERGVKTEPSRNARGIVGAIVRNVNSREPSMSAQQELDTLNEILPSISADDVSRTFAKHFKPGVFTYVLQMPDREELAVPSEADVLAAAKRAWAVDVAPLESDESPTTLLAQMPTAGKVVESSKDDELGITSAWLSNGVRVHHRYMDYKKDSVWVTIALAGGEIEESADTAGVTMVASLAVNDGGTSRLTSTNIRDIMTGVNIGVSASAGGDAFTIRVAGSPDDLELGLQRAHAALVDGKIEKSAFDTWRQGMLQQLEMMETMPPVQAQIAMADLLSGGDPRRSFFTKERVNSQTVERAQAWFDRLAMMAPMEVAIVGDMKLDDVMPLIEKYIGSLPQRTRSAGHLDGLRKLARPTGPLAKHIEVETMTPQAMGIAGFSGCQGQNTDDRRALSLAQQILSSRLVKRVREELGMVYSIRASNSPSWAYEDAGVFLAAAPCDPNKAQQLTDEVHNMFSEFASKGPDGEELKNAKAQIAERLDTSMREPSFWLRLLQHHDLHRRNYNDTKDVKQAYEGMTADQVKSVFQKYYKPTRLFRLTAVPVAEKASDQKMGEQKKPKPTPAS